MPAIDVLLPVRNALPYLSESIESVVNQTYSDWRLLVLDHGSTDGSVELAERYAERDKRIVVLSNPSAQGLGGLLNYGLDKADAKFVFRQDGDDYSYPDRFQNTIDVFSSASDLVLVGGEADVINSGGEKVGYIRRPSSAKAVAAASFFYNPIHHPTVAFNKVRLEQLGARYGIDFMKVVPKEKSINVYSLAEDYLLFGQIALLGRCINIKKPLIQYRYHAGSESVSKRSAQNDCAIAISRFLAQSLAAMTGGASFDPVPFCSHAECVFDLGRKDYLAEFRRMTETLRGGLGESPELERELAFRSVIANRSFVGMSIRYLVYACQNGWHKDEYRLVRNWLARPLNGKYAIPISGGVAPWRGDSA